MVAGPLTGAPSEPCAQPAQADPSRVPPRMQARVAPDAQRARDRDRLEILRAELAREESLRTAPGISADPQARARVDSDLEALRREIDRIQ